MTDYDYLVDRSYCFDDGNSITITQIKRRDDGPWVTFDVKNGPGIKKRSVMPIMEFVENYGHLFNIEL